MLLLLLLLLLLCPEPEGDGTLSAGIFVDFQALPVEARVFFCKITGSWMKSENHWSTSMSIIDYISHSIYGNGIFTYMNG